MTAATARRYVRPDSRTVLEFGAPRTAWLERRQSGIGGADVAAILGMSRWASPRDVWLDKTGRGVEREVTWPMLRGAALEKPLLDYFTAHTGIDHTQVGMQQNVKRPWMLVNPDALTADGGLAEVKTTGFWLRDEWTDGPADYAVLQGQWGLAVTGARHLWVIAAVSDDEPLFERVERDDNLIGVMIDAAGTFWCDHVVADVEPPLMWMDRDALAAQFPEVSEPDPVAGDAKTIEYEIGRRANAAVLIKSYEKVKAEAEANIIAAIADHDTLLIDGKIAATRKQQTARVLDRTALEADIDITPYMTERVSRVLRIPDPAKRKAFK